MSKFTMLNHEFCIFQFIDTKYNSSGSIFAFIRVIINNNLLTILKVFENFNVKAKINREFLIDV